MGLFGGHSEVEHPNFDLIDTSLRTHLGLQLAQPTDDVLAILDQMTHRELLNFDNLHSVEGMQELFRVRWLRADVDHDALTVVLSVATEEELAQEVAAHTERRVLHFTPRHATQTVQPPKDAPLMGVKPEPVAKLAESEPAAPLPAAFEHLEALEHLLVTVMDLFVRYGRLTSADKDVLKKILPLDSSLEARIVALERWQAELTRRVRGIHVARPQQHLLAGVAAAGDRVDPEEALGRRFDAITHWMSKLIKAFEHTGIKYHGKPMWLPH
jgi:hypothetical protein